MADNLLSRGTVDGVRLTIAVYAEDGALFSKEAADNYPLWRTMTFNGDPAWPVMVVFDPKVPQCLTVTIDTVCPDCKGARVIPRAVWMSRGGTHEPDYDHYPLPRVATCPTCYVPAVLTTIEMGRPRDAYTLARSGPRYDVHLAGEAANGGTGPNLCGLDRHARDPDTGRALRGFSVGGGTSGGPAYPGDHAACGPCLGRIAGRPVRGLHAALFRSA